MFTQLDALLALVRHGTMSAAAVSLRVSQSAVSKRIRQLEQQLGKPLIRREGRRTVLTAEGQALVDDVAPLMADLNTVLTRQHSQAREQLSIAVSEAILSSWGAPFLVSLRDARPELDIHIHTHRSPTIVDKVQAGQYPFGLCAGELPNQTGLIAEKLLDEPMVLIACSGDVAALEQARKEAAPVPVICIEEKSNTWQGIRAQADRLKLEPRWPVESSIAAARLALSGWGHALVPKGVASALHALDRSVDLGPDGLTRPATVICRKQVYQHAQEQGLLATVKRLAQAAALG